MNGLSSVDFPCLANTNINMASTNVDLIQKIQKNVFVPLGIESFQALSPYVPEAELEGFDTDTDNGLADHLAFLAKSFLDENGLPQPPADLKQTILTEMAGSSSATKDPTQGNSFDLSDAENLSDDYGGFDDEDDDEFTADISPRVPYKKPSSLQRLDSHNLMAEAMDLESLLKPQLSNVESTTSGADTGGSVANMTTDDALAMSTSNDPLGMSTSNDDLESYTNDEFTDTMSSAAPESDTQKLTRMNTSPSRRGDGSLSPSRNELREARRKAALESHKTSNATASNQDEAQGGTAETSGVTEEELEEEERILKQAAESQMVLKRATNVAARQGVPVEKIQVVDKYGAFVSVPALKEEINAALAVRQKRKERSRARRMALQTAPVVPQFKCSCLNDMTSRHPEEQMRFAFKLADLNGDGRVTKDEIEEGLLQFAGGDEDDEDELWAVERFKDIVNEAFSAGGSASTYVDETHLMESECAGTAVGAPLSVTIDELVALKKWATDVSYYEQVFTKTFLGLLRNAFIAACHETAFLALKETEDVPWFKGIPASSSSDKQSEGAKESEQNIAFLSASGLKAVNELRVNCGGATKKVRSTLARYDSIKSGYIKLNDFKRALGHFNVSEHNIDILAKVCEDPDHKDHYMYARVGDILHSATTLVAEDSQYMEKVISEMSTSERGDTVFSPRLESFITHAKDQWDVFPAALCAKAWKLLKCIRDRKNLSSMIHPGVAVKAGKGGYADSIPLFAEGDDCVNAYSCHEWENALWRQQVQRNYAHIVEASPGGNGIRMKTTPTLEEDETSGAIVWVRLLGFMYDRRASLRKDALTEKEHKRLVTMQRMSAMSKPKASSPSKRQKREEEIERKRRRKERERQKLLNAAGGPTFVERMDKKIAEARKKKERAVEEYENTLKKNALGKRNPGKKADTLGFLKRLQESEELKEKKRRDKIAEEMRKSKPARKKHSEGEQVKKLSRALTKAQKAKAEEGFNKFDIDGSGFIEKAEFEQVVNALGESLTEKDLMVLLRRLDTNGDGTISKDEFMAWWLCRCPSCFYVMERQPVPGRNKRRFVLGTDDAVKWATDYRVLDFSDPPLPPTKEMLICASCYDVYKRDRFIERLDKAEAKRLATLGLRR